MRVCLFDDFWLQLNFQVPRCFDLHVSIVYSAMKLLVYCACYKCVWSFYLQDTRVNRRFDQGRKMFSITNFFEHGIDVFH